MEITHGYPECIHLIHEADPFKIEKLQIQFLVTPLQGIPIYFTNTFDLSLKALSNEDLFSCSFLGSH